MVKRRHFIKNSALGITTAITLNSCRQKKPKIAPSPAQNFSQPSIRWRMATSWPKSLEISFGGAEIICRRVNEMTDGHFIITPYEAGELASGLEVLDGVQSGKVECGHTNSIYYINKNPAFAFGASVPFGLTPQQQNSWLYYGGGLEVLKPLYDSFGVIHFPAGNTGAQMGGWFKRKINNLADLQGLKMRIPGLGSEVMQRLGVDVQVLAVGEILAALLEEKIEAVEWICPYDDEKLGLNKAANYYYYPGWWEPGPTLDVHVNIQEWNKLPKDYQAIFETAAYEANLRVLSQYNAANGQALQRLLLGGTELVAYNLDILKAAQKIAFELYEEKASQNTMFRGIYEQWKAFRSQIYQWHEINELSFAKAAFEN